MADWKLLIEDDAGQTITVPLFRDVITIGRKEGNTIRLTERNVSRFHAKILRENGTVFVEDLQSYTGVKLNGDRIKGRIEVREGDLIEIGDYHLELQREGAEAGAHPSLTEPTQRLTPSPAPRADENAKEAVLSHDANDDEDDEFAGDTQRWEPPAGMDPMPVGMPTVQDQAPISMPDVLGDPPTVDETMPYYPASARPSVVEQSSDPDETLRQDLSGTPLNIPLPTTTDPFAAVEAEAVLAEMTNDEVLAIPGGPEDASLLAAMTEQLPNPVALLDSQPEELALAPDPSPAVVRPAAELTPVHAPSPPRPAAGGIPQSRSLSVEKNIPPVAEGPTEDTQALVRSPGPSDDVHVDKARLVALNTVFAGVVFPIVRLETVIGRVEENDLVIEHRSVSRAHAKIVREGNRYRIVDLKSANGILVNGLEVESHVLRPGDVLELGRVKLRFVPPLERFQLSPAEIERARIADVQGPDDFADETATGVLSSIAAGAYPPPPKQSGMQRSSMIIMALGATVFILALVLVMMLVGGRGGDGEATGSSSSGDENRGSVERANLLEKAGDLKAAADMLSALAADGDANARVHLTRVEQGIANQSRVRELQSHIDAKRYKEAVELAPSINVDAPYADEAKAKVELARVTGADAAFKVTSKALDDGVAAAAEAALANLVIFEPNSDRTREARARLKALQDKSGAKADPAPDDERTRNAGRADRPETRPNEKREVKTSPAAKEKDKDDRKLQPVVDTAAAKKLHKDASVLLLSNKLTQAVSTLNEALKKDPGYADAYRELGTAFKNLGDKKRAIGNFRTYLNMRPNAPDARTVRAWAEDLEREVATP